MQSFDYVFSDPRPEWAAKQPGYDLEVQERKHRVAVARELGDDASIEIASADLDDLVASRLAYQKALEPVDAAIEAKLAADRELGAARAADDLGTPDAKIALKNAERVVVAFALVRHFAREMPRILSAFEGARVRLSRCATGSIGRGVIEETSGFISRLLSYTRVEGAFLDAEEAGRRSSAAKVAWYPIAEAIAKAEFPKKLAAAKGDRALNPVGMGVMLESEGKKLATMADLESCFRRRRDAFAAERRRLEGQLAQMRGQLEDLTGGAA